MFEFPLTNNGIEHVHPISVNLEDTDEILGLNADVQAGLEFCQLLNDSIHINVSTNFNVTNSNNAGESAFECA